MKSRVKSLLEKLDCLTREHQHLSREDKDVIDARLKHTEAVRRKMINIFLNIRFLMSARDPDAEYFQNPSVNVKDLEVEASALMLRYERNRESAHEESLRKYSLLAKRQQVAAKSSEVGAELEKCQKRLLLHSGIMGALNAELGLENKTEEALDLILDVTRGNSASKVQFIKNSIQ